MAKEKDGWINKLYFGDNLTILREHIPNESVDLIYLDPPFNSNASYNVLFGQQKGDEAGAQITAFEDTWHWGIESEAAYREIVDTAPARLVELMQALRASLGQSDMMAYLCMMALRLVELHRVLKSTGSLYLHCDPTASHYLKLVLDAVFAPINFRSEIIWRRCSAHNKLSRQFGPIHDCILFYSKSKNLVFHPGTTPYTKSYIKKMFRNRDQGGVYRSNELTGPGTRSGESGQPWRGYNPTAKGRHWSIHASLQEILPDEASGWTLQEKLDFFHEQGMIIFSASGRPTYKQYAGGGVYYQDIWAYQPGTEGVLEGSNGEIDQDVKWLDAEPENLGYGTQKPEGLLDRIISSSTSGGDLVLDPFCGCGTTVSVAERLKRRWIGIDITHLAIDLMKKRLKDSFGYKHAPFDVLGVPKDLASARELAKRDRYHFEWWALSLVNARPAQDKKKGADKGVDGVIFFHDDESGTAKKAVVQVKSGHVTRNQIGDLKSAMEREKAKVALFVTLEDPTRPMREEAATAGFYEPEHWRGRGVARVQILTIADLLEGKRPDLLRYAPETTFKKAVRKVRDEGGQAPKLF